MPNEPGLNEEERKRNTSFRYITRIAAPMGGPSDDVDALFAWLEGTSARVDYEATAYVDTAYWFDVTVVASAGIQAVFREELDKMVAEGLTIGSEPDKL